MIDTKILEKHTAAALSDAEFYTPPPVESSRGPGEILRLRPVRVPGVAGAGPAWQVLFVSRDTLGAPIPVSGTVIATEVPDEAPLLVYYPSFHGLGGPAPSQRLAAGNEPDTVQIGAALARGWHVAIPDGEGLGVLGQGPHTVLAGHAAGQIMLDLGRAAARIPALHASDAPVACWGCADGGRAAIAAGGLQRDYAPEMNVCAVAAGAVVTDLRRMLRVFDEGAWPALGLAAVLGLSRAYRHLSLRHVFATSARSLLAEVEQASVGVLCERYQHALATWCDRDVVEDPMWQYVFAHERADTRLPGVRVHLYHGSRDAIVPASMGRALAEDYRARGVQVSWREYDADHFRTRVEAIGEVLDFLAAEAGLRALAPAGTGGTVHP
ncbi:lipase family protein [Nocardia macrotermitis]|uniref:Putative inactive lipase n=1 Tax=Nocardia macrotermitis TaxID=2585198 RepID=A0A7K0DCG9_9NOCA|nr:lipase family protein [Nocardia macrotermitis]MQY23012.1 putative inactive lipase [Nocardia macrotermitis]